MLIFVHFVINNCNLVIMASSTTFLGLSHWPSLRPLKLRRATFLNSRFVTIMFKSVYFTGLTRSIVHVGGAINSAITDCAQYTN